MKGKGARCRRANVSPRSEATLCGRDGGREGGEGGDEETVYMDGRWRENRIQEPVFGQAEKGKQGKKKGREGRTLMEGPKGTGSIYSMARKEQPSLRRPVM
jgi:GTPase involved in cell partitioning and DNA repair